MSARPEVSVVSFTEARPKNSLVSLTDPQIQIPGFITISKLDNPEGRGIVLYITPTLKVRTL